MKIKFLVLTSFILLQIHLFSQNNVPSVNAYPKVAAYFSVVHPIVTLSSNAPVYNFDHSYTVGFPVGINLLKSDLRFPSLFLLFLHLFYCFYLIVRLFYL